MTRRERLERKLEKRQEWAESRERKADSARRASDAVPLPPGGEPIKVGHHSEKRHRAAIEKCHNLMYQSFDHQKMAEHHTEKADGLAAQLDGSIFSDDADAIEQLEARIAEREAERDRIKAYNASCRKGKPDLSLLDDKQRRDILSIAKHCSYQLGKTGQFPSYTLSYLSKNIKSDQKRIAEIRTRNRRQAEADAAGGVKITHNAAGSCQVTFSEYPGRPITQALKAAHYHWSGGSWFGQYDNLPAEVRDMEGGAA